MAQPVGIRIRRALAYAEPVGFRPLELDLYLPPGGPAPLVVYLHGGGWLRGSRRQCSPAFARQRPPLLEQIAACGFAVASVDYRLSSEACFPAQLDDVRAALGWLHEHAGGLGIDSGRTVLWGDSAGGHLAALAALLSDETGPGGPRVVGVVTWYALTDLVNLEADATASGGESHAGPDTREGRFLGGSLEDLPEQARWASPVTHVRPGAPPFLLLHGDADTMVPTAQSSRLADALLQAGNEADLELVEGVDHLWRGATEAQLAHIVEVTVAFLRARTALRPPSPRFGPRA